MRKCTWLSDFQAGAAPCEENPIHNTIEIRRAYPLEYTHGVVSLLFEVRS